MENVQNVYEFKWQTPFSEIYRIKSDFHYRGTSRCIWLGTALQAGMPRFRDTMVSLEFLIDIILPAAVWPEVDSASNRNYHQEYFLGCKDRRWLTLTLPPSYAECLEVWKPQPPGTLWARIGLIRDCCILCST